MPHSPRRLGIAEDAKPLRSSDGRRSRAYDSRWRRFARQFSTAFPLCVLCICRGKLGQASRVNGRERVVVDHIEPFHGAENERTTQYDPRNLQPLCKRCHDADKAKLEARTERGRRRGAWLEFLRRELTRNGAWDHAEQLAEYFPSGVSAVLSTPSRGGSPPRGGVILPTRFADDRGPTHQCICAELGCAEPDRAGSGSEPAGFGTGNRPTTSGGD